MTVNAMTVSAGEALKVLLAGWDAQAAGGLTVSWMLHGRPGRRQDADRPADGRPDGREALRPAPDDHRAAGPARPALLRSRDEADGLVPARGPARRRPGGPVPRRTHGGVALPQPTVYGLLQERRVGRHLLPDSVFVVAAGNAVEDGAVAYEMGTALSDRLMHMPVRATASDWLDNYRRAARAASGGDGLHPHTARPSGDDRGGAGARADDLATPRSGSGSAASCGR